MWKYAVNQYLRRSLSRGNSLRERVNQSSTVVVVREPILRVVVVLEQAEQKVNHGVRTPPNLVPQPAHRLRDRLLQVVVLQRREVVLAHNLRPLLAAKELPEDGQHRGRTDPVGPHLVGHLGQAVGGHHADLDEALLVLYNVRQSLLGRVWGKPLEVVNCFCLGCDVSLVPHLQIKSKNQIKIFDALWWHGYGVNPSEFSLLISNPKKKKKNSWEYSSVAQQFWT